MAIRPATPTTDFTLDVMGRYLCNSLEEALQSTDTTLRPDARPFDVVVIGCGSFGSALAEHLLQRDRTHSHRILVLEAGPFVLPEHVQNLPLPGLNVPGATTIHRLQQDGSPQTRGEVWGLPWHSPAPFTGLAYCIGGRSLFFGGWSPQPLDSEVSVGPWNSAVVDDLNIRYFREASEQLGANVTNDFIHDPLHYALREQLFEGLNGGKVTDAIPLNLLPLHLDNVPPDKEDLAKLEAPLAVQCRTLPGSFPFNKYSSVSLLMKAAAATWYESGYDNVKKRLMVVPNCHVKRLVTGEAAIEGGRATRRVTVVETSQGNVPVPHHGVVIMSLGTIESTRLALLSFEGIPNYDLIGRNLMAHLRSNLTIRIPREALPNNEALPKALQASALFVKGRHKHTDGTVGHFHLQITAAGLEALGTDTEAELFKKVPDIDTFEVFRLVNDKFVVITIRGIGEMESQNPDSQVRLDPELDEFGMPRAFVTIADPHQAERNVKSNKDLALWNAMDRAADEVARVFANRQPFEVLTPCAVVKVAPDADLAQVLPYAYGRHGGRRDELGTTHHEGGTLWMGDDPNRSATNPDGRFYYVSNAYVAGPALFPKIGSSSPWLTGVALARRLADRLMVDRLLPALQPTQPEAGFESLFDGTEETFKAWHSVGEGSFALIKGEIITQPGGDLGLLYCTLRKFGDFTLRLQFRLNRADDSSGIFVRSRDPRQPAPDRYVPSISHPYKNQAYVAVDTGFEVQIDELARGNPHQGIPDGLDEHRTGAIYGIQLGQGVGRQEYCRGPVLKPGEWNDCEIEVIGDTFTVRLNEQEITTFSNPDTLRGRSPENDPESGYIGLQAHIGCVAFRNIRVLSGRAVTPPPRKQERERVETVALSRDIEAPIAQSSEETIKAQKIQPKAKKAAVPIKRRA